MQYCTGCGYEATGRFCGGCGAEQHIRESHSKEWQEREAGFCTSCGSPVSTAFCGQCGQARGGTIEHGLTPDAVAGKSNIGDANLAGRVLSSETATTIYNEPKSKSCPTCHAIVPLSAKICATCAGPLPLARRIERNATEPPPDREKECAACGRIAPSGANICAACNAYFPRRQSRGGREQDFGQSAPAFRTASPTSNASSRYKIEEGTALLHDLTEETGLRLGALYKRSKIFKWSVQAGVSLVVLMGTYYMSGASGLLARASDIFNEFKYANVSESDFTKTVNYGISAAKLAERDDDFVGQNVDLNCVPLGELRQYYDDYWFFNAQCGQSQGGILARSIFVITNLHSDKQAGARGDFTPGETLHILGVVHKPVDGTSSIGASLKFPAVQAVFITRSS